MTDDPHAELHAQLHARLRAISIINRAIDEANAIQNLDQRIAGGDLAKDRAITIINRAIDEANAILKAALLAETPTR